MKKINTVVMLRYIFQKLILIIILALLMTSCKEKDFEFQVINKTYFDIIEFDLDWCQGDHKFAIGPDEESEVYVLSSKSANLGSLCFGVTLFSNTSGANRVFTNNCGWARGREHFSTARLNKIIILEDMEGDTTDCVGNLFLFEFE